MFCKEGAYLAPPAAELLLSFSAIAQSTAACLAFSSLLFKAMVVHMLSQSHMSVYKNLEVSTRRNETGKKIPENWTKRRKNLPLLKGSFK